MSNDIEQIAEAKQEWVDVENADAEKKPEGKVLVAFGEPFFGKRTTEIEAGYYDEESGKWRFWLTEREIVGYGVTHWMPLPEPPGQTNE